MRLAGISAVALALATSVCAAKTTRLTHAALVAAEARARPAIASLAMGPAHFDTIQAFTITVAGAKRQVLPVRYTSRAPAPVANVDHCALVILSPERVQIVQTVGTGYTEPLGCIGLEAIGFGDLDGDGHLDIALIQATLVPPDRFLKTPVVVRGEGDGDFVVDETLTAALDERGGIATIGALRRAVAQRRAAATPRKGRDGAPPSAVP